MRSSDRNYEYPAQKLLALRPNLMNLLVAVLPTAN